MDSKLELSLLIQRFPDYTIQDFGSILKDFFCARSVFSGTYGGRLFVTKNTLVFVSTYLNSKSYDFCVPLRDITLATTFHKSIIPSLEIDWTEGKESFTNFYDLQAVERTLKDTLPPENVKTKHGSVRGLNRLCSVPVSVNHSSSSSPAFIPKADPCPFFSKCGFCPRHVVCKLDHFIQQTMPPLQNNSSERGLHQNGTNSNGDNPGPSIGTFQRSPSKKQHMQGSKKGKRKKINSSAEKLNVDDLHPPQVNSDFTRSVSSPTVVHYGTRKNPQSRIEHAQSGLTSSHDSSGGDSIAKTNTSPPEIELPKSFDFSSRLSPNSRKEEEEFHTPSGTPADKEYLTPVGSEEFVTPAESSTNLDPFIPVINFTRSDEHSDRERNVFIFSALSSSSERRDTSASPVLVGSGEASEMCVRDGEGIKREGDEETSREVALLTQQLELESDDNSLHGDLDIEAQMRVMKSFSDEKIEIPEAPPPYSALKPLVSAPYDPLQPPPPEQLSPNEETGDERGHKRQPCLYFMAGYCRNGAECPNFHGIDPDLDDMEFEELSLVPIPSKIIVHSGLGIGRSDINSGDKIILSPHILLSCEQLELSYPIAFKMENALTGRTVYGGVLQFTSPSPNFAYLPQWMMEHLQVQDGDEVSFQNVDLPKGKFVRLQPVSSSWLGIPYDKRMAMMEFQLRNFQTLTEGTKVTLTYELNKYTLKVLECRPAKGISIVDADLTTDIIEPADLNRFHSVEEGQAENIDLGEPMKCDVKSDSYRHFVLLSLPGKPLPLNLRVEVESSKGDADLFLSQTVAAPSQCRYTWCNQEVERSIIQLNSEDEKNYDITKPIYAGVMGVLEDAEFTITFHDDTLTQTTAAKACVTTSSPPLSGKTLRGIASSNEPEAKTTHPSLDPLPPGYVQCLYCSSAMPSLRLIMHERHCVQSTFKCPLCKICLPKAAEKKHSSVSHQLLVCECGEELTQLALHRHQETDCSKRMVTCPFKWCNLCFPMDQLTNHENICGRKKVECPVCKEEVSQLEMEMHLVAFHRVEIDKIDWKKPLINQDLVFKKRELQFKCQCGVEFEFQDDMEVHQLTECSLRRLAEDEEKLPIEGEVLVSMDIAPDSIIG